MSLPRVIGERLAITWVLSLVGVFAFDFVRYVVDTWRFDLPVHTPSLIDTELFGMHSFTGWIVFGLGGAVAVAWALTSAHTDRRWLRAVAWIGAAGAAAMLIGTIYEWSWRNRNAVPYELAHTLQNVALLTTGVIAALWVATKKLSPMPDRRRLRALVIAAAAAGGLVLGGPTVAETWREYQPQQLPNFTVELVAAYPAANAPPGAELVTTKHGRFRLDRSDTLRFTRGHVRRVRRRDGGVSIRTSGRVVGQIRARSKRRMSQHDAIFINGELISVPLYQGYLMNGRLFISDRDRSERERLYRVLTTAR